jgi:hypothetical protein
MKTLLVVFGVMIMFVFVIGDALVSYYRGPQGGGDGAHAASATAVSWDGGSLTNADVRNLIARRQITNEFLRQVEGIGAQTALEAGIEPRPLPVQRLIGAETPQQGVEQDVVYTKLFADAARNAGMRVTDGAIVQYLNELGRGNVTNDDMRGILERMRSSGWRVNIQFIIDALREEMLARNYGLSHRFAFETMTPQQQWEDWLSLNDRVVVEAAAIPVESFMVDVPEPTAAELQTFFDEHDQRDPQPDPAVRLRYGGQELPMPVPGFAIPQKIDVQYIEAHFDDFVTKVENEITDEEIAKYYEDNKELFIKADTTLMDDFGEGQDAAPPTEGETQETATEESINSEATEPAETTTETPPPADSPEAEQPAAEGESNAAGDSPTTEPASESDDQVAPGDDDQSSLNRDSRDGRFRLAAFLQETDAASDNAAAATSGDDQQAPTVESGGAASSTEAAAGKSTAGATAAETPASETPEAATPPADKPKEYQPLEEVSDAIRRDMAERRVVSQLKDLMDTLAGQLKGEFDKYIGQVFDAESQNQPRPTPPPALADLAALAAQHGLKSGATGPMSLLEFRDTPVGKSGDGESGQALALTLYGTRDLDLHQPVSTMDVFGNRYIVMKTSDTPRRVPKLDEIRDEVVRAWKKEQASKLALKHAEEVAKKAQESGSPLADYFADDQSIQVVTTDAFSELTGGDVAIIQDQYQQRPFRLSQPDEIVAPGPEFLQKSFELKDGEVGAALNHDHSIAYVIRVVEHQDSPEELQSAFLSEANMWQGLQLKLYQHRQQGESSLVADVGPNVKWERTPDQVEEEDETEIEDGAEE